MSQSIGAGRARSVTLCMMPASWFYISRYTTTPLCWTSAVPFQVRSILTLVTMYLKSNEAQVYMSDISSSQHIIIIAHFSFSAFWTISFCNAAHYLFKSSSIFGIVPCLRSVSVYSC